MRDRLNAGGADPIDSRLGSGAVARRGGWIWRRHALGLAASPVPSFAALLAGIVLGPFGLGILTPRVLLAVEPVTAAATVALGVLIGLELDIVRRPVARRLVAGATVESGVTLLAIAATFSMVVRLAGWEWAAAPYLPLLLGVAAASSAIRVRGEETSVLGRLCELDDLLPVVVGAVMLAYAAGESIGGGLVVLGLTSVLTVTIAIAGSLLVSGSGTEGERRVYTTGSVLLLTGLAASLSSSTLFVGALAAGVWNLSSETARESLARDVGYLQHPIVVLVLVIAGAEASTSMPVLVLAGVFALVRVAGKTAGGALASHVVSSVDRWLGLRLVAPGVAGLAAVLMVVHVTRIATVADPLLGIAVWGAILSDLLSMLVSPPEADA